jgi:acetyl esterase/lipase
MPLVIDERCPAEHYKPDTKSPLRSPLIFPSHEGLPPAYIQVCGADPLRDEGLIYEQVLREANVRTKLDIFPGLPHGFWSWFPEAGFSKVFQAKTVDGLKWLLGQGESR